MSSSSPLDRRDRARASQRELSGLLRSGDLIARMRELQSSMRGCDALALQEHARQLARFLRTGHRTTDPQILSLAGAIVCEAVEQTLGKRLFDVQLHAGIVLSCGAVAEMATGEGKTFSGLLPAVLHGLCGFNVHVATTNSYLAERDCSILQPAIERIGLSAGLLTDKVDPDERRTAYQCDITFGPGYAFGFDYLRDQFSLRSHACAGLGAGLLRRLRGGSDSPSLIQRGHHFAIVDEIDHVLIDDAMSPLVLSGASEGEAPDAELHRAARELAEQLIAGDHYTPPGDGGTIRLTAQGLDAIYAENDSANHPMLVRAWHEYVQLALKALYEFRRDIHYIVKDSAVQIVDVASGRIHADRSWNDGVHQAIEAREGLPITPELIAQATITRQRFYRMYDKLCGMTGTATDCRTELQRVYGLSVLPIPLRTASRRQARPVAAGRDQTEKIQQIVREVIQCHHDGQPVLIGTHSIRDSHRIAEALEDQGLNATLLNGVQDALEAEVIARAGTSRAVTVATHMAGRGTDIQLDSEAAVAGGLHVILSQPNALSRVDRQLIGRSARSGDPGSYRVYVACDDPLFSKNAPWVSRWIRRALKRGTLDEPRLAQMISRAQGRVQRQQTSIRLQLLRQDLREQSIFSPDSDTAPINASVA